MEEQNKEEKWIESAEESDKRRQDFYLKTDAAIAERITQRAAARMVSKDQKPKPAERVEPIKQSPLPQNAPMQDILQSEIKQAVQTTKKEIKKEMMKETVQRTAVEAGKETVKKGTEGIVKESSNAAASFIIASSGSSVGTAGGMIVGSSAGPIGTVAGMVAGNVAGNAVNAGATVLMNQSDRVQTLRKNMIAAMKRGEDPKIMSNLFKSGVKEIFYGFRLGQAFLSLFPTLRIMVTSLVIACLLSVSIAAMILGVICFCVAPYEAVISSIAETIGQLAGGQDVIYYCQMEEPWASYPYGDSTISVCGCGPTTMAILVSTLTGETCTPSTAADAAMTDQYYIPGSGTTWSYFSAGASAYGLTSTSCGTDLLTALECIPEGGMVVISVGKPDVNGEAQGNDLYRGTGHFMAIRGLTSDGKILVADPASRSNTEKEWDFVTVNDILKQCWSITYTPPEDTEGET